jgi:uncharacterized protein (TIGR00661 family)
MMLQIKGNETVLVCPLGWGLGHASRLIPIIQILINKGCKVICAGDNSSINLIQSRFPNIQIVRFPSINVKLSRGNKHLLVLAVIAIKLFLRTITKYFELKKIIKRHGVNIVISDNRYGLFSKRIVCILITHQLKVKFPTPFKWAEPLGEWYIRRYANQFNECWIPDNPEGFRVSGELSSPKKYPRKVKFIGLLSRFTYFRIVPKDQKWDLVAIVSGPAPHREIFEKELIDLSQRLSLKSLIIQGLPPDNVVSKISEKVTLVPHLSDEEMADAILSAKTIICRSGYSTIMDLMAMNKAAILVPTPGQTEQEYLAFHLSQAGFFNLCAQNSLKKLSKKDIFQPTKNQSTVNQISGSAIFFSF